MSCALAHYESLQFVVINNRCRLYFWPRSNGLFLVSSSLCYEHLRFFTRQWFHLHLRFRTLGGSRRDPVKCTRQRALSTTDGSRYHCCWHLLASAVDVASRISSQRSSAPGACYWLHLARRWREFIAQNGCRVLFPQRSSSHGGTQGRGVTATVRQVQGQDHCKGQVKVTVKVTLKVKVEDKVSGSRSRWRSKTKSYKHTAGYLSDSWVSCLTSLLGITIHADCYCPQIGLDTGWAYYRSYIRPRRN